MATYGQLLIDAGGGIIDRGKQSDRQDGATVIIGLGGTGTDALIKLKKEIYKQLKPDNENAIIPSYDAIKYLVIDSDSSEIDKQPGVITDIDKGTEYADISNSVIASTFAAKKVMENRKELDWLDYEHIGIKDAGHGAGGIRQVGRFLLVDQAMNLYSKIQTTINSALIAARTGDINVHICAGISGGTGSGTFLDICYLVREALIQIGKGSSNISGYFFLPDVNLSVPAVMADPLKSQYIKVNGYAALQELDYCMNFDKNKDSFKMNYGFKQIDCSMPPVDLCYLISSTDKTGKVIKNGYQYAMGVVTDYIINYLAQVKLPEGVNAQNNKGLTLEGHISNLNSIKLGISLQHGASVDYNILGASVAEMPLSEIATYLGAKLFERYSDIYDRMPTEKERDEFAARNQLRYEDIRKSLAGRAAAAVNFPANFDVSLYKTTGNHHFVDRAAEFLANNKGELEKNCKTLLEEIDGFDIPRDSASLINRTYKSLCENYTTRIEYGPFFAKRMLYGNDNQNLLHLVDGYIIQNEENLNHELRQSQTRDDEYETAKIRMDSANFLNEKGRLKEYMNALNNLYIHHYKVALYKTMGDVLQAYRKQILNLDRNMFNVLANVMETLRETFRINARVLSEGEKTENSYTWKILSIPDVKDGLEQIVKNLDLGKTLDDLMRAMFVSCSKWINEDENEIRKLISDFVLEEFATATSKTMTDYLYEKFGVTQQTLLEAAIEKKIIQEELLNKSTPLFWQNPMYHAPVGQNSTLTVPYNAVEIKNAAGTFSKDKMEFVIRESSITDKLSMMRFYSGIPMYAYQGIHELQEAYEQDNKPGRHLYEKGLKDWNKMLPSPIPASFDVGRSSKRIKERNAVLIREFEAAEEAEVIIKNELNQWNIMLTDESFHVEEYVKEVAGSSNIAELNAKVLTNLAEKLAGKKQELVADAREERIEYLKADAGNERQVMMDFYLMAPVLNRKVKDELARRRKLEDTILEVQAEKEKKKKKISEQRVFFNAIFTGVITYGNKIVFSYDEFGMEKNVELQNNSMDYGQSGAYQAYKTYESLSNKIKGKIGVLTQERMDGKNMVEVEAVSEELKISMPRRISSYLSIYETDDKLGEIEKFYTDFMKAFQDFRMVMGI
ncbi:MAG: tubulin-like doman-containing protein [Lachnospiraceae bacterium]|nr:tubulin-like doman-containing protein [Lachnospiraceae bacterium]